MKRAAAGQIIGRPRRGLPRGKAASMREGIVDELKAFEPELIEIRHDIHRHPETGFQET